jgi:hypothetical protein
VYFLFSKLLCILHPNQRGILVVQKQKRALTMTLTNTNNDTNKFLYQIRDTFVAFFVCCCCSLRTAPAAAFLLF